MKFRKRKISELDSFLDQLLVRFSGAFLRCFSMRSDRTVAHREEQQRSSSELQ